jgi:hypothetical protein
LVEIASLHLDGGLECRLLTRRSNMKKTIMLPVLAATLCSGTVLAGDGSDEPGFVPPPQKPKPPPRPPRTVSSAETFIGCCCCPVTPMARTEAKKPPSPPTLITKLRGEKLAPGTAPKVLKEKK